MMTILRKRPLAAACALFITCLLLFSLITATVKIVVSSVIACALLSLLLIPRMGSLIPVTFLSVCAIVLACALSVHFFDGKLASAQSLCGKDAPIVARIDEVRTQTGYASSYRVTLLSVGGEEANIRAALYTDYASDACAGDTVFLTVSFVPFDRDLHGFDMYRYSVANGVLVSCESYDESAFQLLKEEKQESLAAVLSRSRARVGAMIETASHPADAGFLKALLLGDTTDLDPSVERDFRTLGISHVLAISGMHLTVIIGSLATVLSLFGVRRRTRYVLLLLPLLFYVALTGASPPILRAAFMMLFGEASFCFGRKSDGITSLFAAVTMILVLSPYAVYDCGLWLSFAAMIALIAAERVWKRMKTVEKLRAVSGVRVLFAALLLYALNTVLTSVFASVCILPLAFLFFGSISVFAVVANLLIAPLIGIVLTVSPLLVLLWDIPALSGVVAAAVHAALEPALRVSGALAAVPGVLLPLDFPFSSVLIAVTFAVTIALVLLVPRKRYAAIALFLGTAILLVGTYANLAAHREHTAVACVSEPTGDAMLFSVGTKTMLVDLSGGGYSVFQAASTAARLMHATEIDTLLLPYLTVHHGASTVRLLANTHVRTLMLPVPNNAEEMHLFDTIARTARESGTTVVFFSPEAPHTLDFYGIRLTMFAQQTLDRSDVPVLSLSAEVGGQTVAYLGGGWSETGADAIPAEVTVLGSFGATYEENFALDHTGRVIALSDAAYEAFRGDARQASGCLWITEPCRKTAS